ncbi:MAG: amino acid permease [Mycoplasmatales bacterium]
MEKKKLNSFSIALLLFIAVFGMTNIPANYASLGNSAIGWFILLAIYFVPLALVIGELSSHKINSKSGMNGWISLGLNERWSFIGSWSYFVVNIFYLPMLASRIPVLFSWTFTSTNYTLADVVNNSGNIDGIINAVDNKMMFLMLAFFVLIISLILGIFFKKVFSSIAKFIGWTSLIITGLFIILGIAGAVFGGEPVANPITIQNAAPKLNLVALSTFAWIVFAIAGIETIGSYTPHVDNAKKRIPKGALLASILVIGAYIIGFIALSLSLTPEQVPVDSMENMISIMYAQVGIPFGFGAIYLRIITFIFLIITLSALVLWTNATVISLFEEFPKGIFPEKVINKKVNDVPIFGLLITMGMVAILLLISSTAIGDNIYLTMYDMSTIAVLLPYLLIAVSYIAFCLKNENGFNIIKSRALGLTIGLIIFIVTLIAMIFSIFDLTIYDASLKNFNEVIQWAILSGGGLLYFILLGVGLYEMKKSKIIGSGIMIISTLILIITLFK